MPRIDLDRLRTAIRARRDLGRGSHRDFPAWLDARRVRILLAAVLAALAVVVALRGDPDIHPTDVVVAAHDLPPGRVLAEGDLLRVPRPAGTVPEGAIRDPARVHGATLTAALRAGEVVTDLRVVGPRLAGVAAGVPDARIVPLRLADAAVAGVLRPGDRVDIVAAESGGESAHAAPASALATDAVVVLVTGAEASAARDRGSGERIVLVAVDARRAPMVAGASLHTALTVVFH